jgi:hypothetical protein
VSTPQFGGIIFVHADGGGDREVPALREVVASYAGVVCPDCQAETGWDEFEWLMFMSGLSRED